METDASITPERIERFIEGFWWILPNLGIILKQGGTVQGTATAASLWGTGAIGTAVGLGSYEVAVMITIFTVATLRLLSHSKQNGPLKEDKNL